MRPDVCPWRPKHLAEWPICGCAGSMYPRSDGSGYTMLSSCRHSCITARPGASPSRCKGRSTASTGGNYGISSASHTPTESPTKTSTPDVKHPLACNGKLLRRRCPWHPRKTENHPRHRACQPAEWAWHATKEFSRLSFSRQGCSRQRRMADVLAVSGIGNQEETSSEKVIQWTEAD